MSRSKKKSKKKQKRTLALLVGGGVLAACICGFLIFSSGKRTVDEVVTPDKTSEIDVTFEHGEGQDLSHTSQGDLNKDKDHSLPPYLENYLNNKKENTPTGNPSGGSGKNPESGKADSSKSEGYLEVHFIDVGQGDSILIAFVDTNLDNGDDSAAMLVDAGDSSKGTAVRKYIKDAGIEELTYFVCTHPDSDHIGGAASVVSNRTITSGIVWGPDYKKDTKTYNNLLNEIKTKNYKYEEPAYGQEYSLGLASFVFIAPLEEHKDPNSNSLVFKLWYGEDEFLFVGDCEEEEELEIVNGSYSAFLDADVLKVGHHGSKTASSEAFLSLVTPSYAVISCGEGNSYKHPHEAALANLRSSGASLYRTDVQGTIKATATGSGITWSAPPCNDWSVGN